MVVTSEKRQTDSVRILPCSQQSGYCDSIEDDFSIVTKMLRKGGKSTKIQPKRQHID